MTTEQMAVSDAEQQTEATEQETPVAAIVEGAVAEAEQRAVATPDFDTPEGIREFLRQHPASEAVLADERNAERQRRDRELRIERGTETVARAYQDHLATKYGVQLDEADQKDAPLWVKANRDTERHGYWRTATEQALDAFDVTDRERITAALDQFEGLPDQTEQIARQVIDTAVSRQVTKRIADLTLDDIPKGSKLWDSVQAEAAKEIEARAQEKETPPPPPRTPVGTVAGQRTQTDYAGMSPEQIAVLPDAEYRIAMGYRQA